MSIVRFRVLGFHQVPPAAGRKLHIIEDIGAMESVNRDRTRGLFQSRGLLCL